MGKLAGAKSKKPSPTSSTVHAVISRNRSGTAVVKPGHAQLLLSETIEWENTLREGVELSIVWLGRHFKQTLGVPKQITPIPPGQSTKPFKAKKVTGIKKTYQIFVPDTGELVVGGSDPDIEIK